MADRRPEKVEGNVEENTRGNRCGDKKRGKIGEGKEKADHAYESRNHYRGRKEKKRRDEEIQDRDERQKRRG